MTSSGSLPLHFNPRFGFGGCWQTVLNSSPRSGQWANEERHANMVQIGVPFELQICAEHDKYVVSFILLFRLDRQRIGWNKVISIIVYTINKMHRKS